MVGEAVKQCPGQAFRPEDLGPLVEGQVGGHQDGAPLVALAEDLEEQFRSGGGQGDEAQLIDGQQVEQPSFVPGLQRSALPSFHRRDSPARLPRRCTWPTWRCWTAGPAAWSRSPAALAGNSPLPKLRGWLENPVYFSLAGRYTFAHSSQGCSRMTLYGYARVSVREPEDKNLDLQVERLVRAGCSLGNIRAEEASGARNDRGGLLELLDLVVEADTLVVTHIDRLSRGLTHGLQVIEGLHRAGVEFRSLSEDFDTATATGKLQLTMVLAFSEWWRNSIRERPVAGQAKARAEGRFPGRRPSLNERQREYIRAERSKGVSQRDLAKRLEVSRWTIQQVDR